MKARQWITAAVLFALALATILGVFFTDSTHSAAPAASKNNAAASQPPAVDQKPLQTARKLAALASTPEEQDFAHEALRLADYEVDLAFADALREAAERPPAPSAEQRELSARASKAAAVVKNDQDQITHLTHHLAAANENAKEDIQDQIDVVKAQLEIDQDELDDAKEDLQRSGGNPQGVIERLPEEHDAGTRADAARSVSRSVSRFRCGLSLRRVRLSIA
jgi:small-conductance mechanosensitive channel